MEPTIAYLDCSGGMSETLLLGALLDLGFPLKLLEQALSSIQLFRGYQPHLTVCDENGVRGPRFSILHTTDQTADLTSTDIQKLLTSSSLAPHIQQKTMDICNCLLNAKIQTGAKVDIEATDYLVGSANAIVTLIGIVLGLDFLGITQIYASPLPLTNGSIQTNQGTRPTVNPITLEILSRAGAVWRPSLCEAELVTPLGAAILATFARFDAPSPLLRIDKIGYGLGQSEPSSSYSDKACSYSLRLCIGQPHVEQEAPFMPHHEPSILATVGNGAETDWITVIESHIDNMSGELLGGFMERLFSAGALDVTYTPIQMKKNCPATLLTILCTPEIGKQLALLVLQETTTLGVRMQQVRRLKAQRYQTTVSTSLGPIKVKVKHLGSRIISAAPEYEECQRIAREHDMPLMAVYEVARGAIQATILDQEDD